MIVHHAPGAAPLPQTVEASAGATLPPIADVPRRISSIHLFAGATEVRIDHHGVIYRLKQTALGKLILTK